MDGASIKRNLQHDPLSWWNGLPDAWKLLLECDHAIVHSGHATRASTITSIRVDESSGISDLGPLAIMGNLEELICDNLPVTDLSPLPGLQKLKKLSLRNTGIVSLDPLRGCKALYEMNIAGCPIDDFAALASLPKLGILQASRTSLESLHSLQSCSAIHILIVEETRVGFEELLRYSSRLWKMRAESDATYSFFIQSNFHQTPESFAQALAAVRFPLDGMEDLLCTWTNEQLSVALKTKSNSLILNRLLHAFFQLSLPSISQPVREELAANILVPIVSRRCEAAIEQLFFERMLILPVKLAMLHYNLACYYATRGEKELLLQYSLTAMAAGYASYKFRLDTDFAACQNDQEFVSLLENPPLPDPHEYPVEWLNLLPESLQDTLAFFLKENSPDGIRELL